MNRWTLMIAVLLLSAASIAMGQQVVMNEIQSRGVAGALDWIEIYNPGNSAVDLSVYKIYDSGGQAGTKPKKPFPAGTIIPARGFYVIITDTADFAGDNSGFGLSSSGEWVWLKDTVAGVVVDSVQFGATANASQTYGRGPDGGAWTILNTITRGTSNGTIMMNEIYSRGTTGVYGDWVEIYNTVSATVSLDRFKIYDSGGQAGTKPKKAFPVGATIVANGFFVITTDTVIAGDASDFGLSSGGEKVWLEDTVRGVFIDTVTFGAMSATQTWSRIPDGGTWGLVNVLTPGATNGTGTAVEPISSVPGDFALAQNYPNPFNPMTTIRFTIPAFTQLRLTVFNLLGQEIAVIAEGEYAAGTHLATFDASVLPSGMYLYRLSAGQMSEVRSMMLVK